MRAIAAKALRYGTFAQSSIQSKVAPTATGKKHRARVDAAPSAVLASERGLSPSFQSKTSSARAV
jgi:hypothetical protein